MLKKVFQVMNLHVVSFECIFSI